MYKTKTGLRLRAIGDNPRAAGTAGIAVKRYRYAFVILSGMLAALGGSYLSIVQNSLFVQDMVAGRGFMALAANIFGGWNPLGSFIASLVFAFAQAVRFNLGGLGVPDQFIQMMPYVFTLIILIAFRRKTRAPEALGEIYE
jgi:simple sugar transport system permease protein